ncbi:glycosyltransferase family 2 protein [Pantanalinema sp. GBBB05]|uniref:glycosyltransferase family 2 protein n=1 Tax=Pantanalinema sp. GBBB05 TaxID=2604139 RepID=UPI001D517DD5|nr:glycosyltransferase family 2 protein [Pantanalinema sp. GBBB05]
MTDVKIDLERSLPSFSLVLETENLENADLNDLLRSLTSLANQKISPQQANEVLLIDSGDTPAELLAELCHQYPWITVKTAPPATGYYTAKMLGATLATGEIIVYFDSDCIYESDWLKQMLLPFIQNPAINVVAGETRTRGRGAYGTAMALTYIFPPYSGQTKLTPVPQYFLNNVAFRREFLLQHPIADNLPLFRGNCVLHAHDLRQQGYTIWRQPLARATHAPPEYGSHFFWRFLLIGHDYYWQKQLLKARTATAISKSDRLESFREGGFRGKVQVFFERVQKLFADDRRHWLYLPLAIPIAATSILLIFIGYWITRCQPDYLLKAYERAANTGVPNPYSTT